MVVSVAGSEYSKVLDALGEVYSALSAGDLLSACGFEAIGSAVGG